MDTGVWTLRCQSCGEPFSLQLTAGENIVEYTKSHRCPHCQRTPEDSAPGGIDDRRWHRVIGFNSTKNGGKNNS
jgi:hypothetical protein